VRGPAAFSASKNLARLLSATRTQVVMLSSLVPLCDLKTGGMVFRFPV
jgi:hypothetical protein